MLAQATATATANRVASCGALRNRWHGQVRAGGNVPIQAADLKLTPCLPGVAAKGRLPRPLGDIKKQNTIHGSRLLFNLWDHYYPGWAYMQRICDCGEKDCDADCLSGIIYDTAAGTDETP